MVGVGLGEAVGVFVGREVGLAGSVALCAAVGLLCTEPTGTPAAALQAVQTTAKRMHK